MKKNILFSIMMAFIFAVTFSAGISYSLSYYYNMYTVVQDLEADMLELSSRYTQIYNPEKYSHFDVSQMLTTSIYQVDLISNNEAESLGSEALDAMDAGDRIIKSRFLSFEIKCYFKAGDRYLRISSGRNSHIMESFGDRVGMTMCATVLLSIIMMFIASRHISRPIRELNLATKKVSGGDFDVRVEVDDDNKSEVGNLARSFNSMVCELKSNELLKSDFISNVSHEFKTPLATINGFAKLLKDGNCTPEETAEFIQIIESETNRLTVLCGNILKLSKLENQTIAPKASTFSIDEQLRNSILTLEPQWTAKNIELDVDMDEASLTGDEELLYQVWTNLIGNAIKFTPDGGTVGVKLVNNNSSVAITIWDTGIGMSEETQKHIFEKFYQGDTAHATHGNGLGLALVQKIVELHKGRITVKAELGKGSEFRVEL